jgi:pyrophosphatase PpaX
MPLRAAMRLLLDGSGHPGDDDAMIDKLIAEYRCFNLANHDQLAKPFPNVRQVVETLKTRGYAVGVVTSKSTELGRRGLRLFDLDDLFDTRVFLEDTDRHKPDPEPVLAALEKLRVEPRSAAYVGDSPFDLIAGRASGVRTVAAMWGPLPRASLLEQNPDSIAEKVTDLLGLF